MRHACAPAQGGQAGDKAALRAPAADPHVGLQDIDAMGQQASEVGTALEPLAARDGDARVPGQVPVAGIALVAPESDDGLLQPRETEVSQAGRDPDRLRYG